MCIIWLQRQFKELYERTLVVRGEMKTVFQWKSIKKEKALYQEKVRKWITKRKNKPGEQRTILVSLEISSNVEHLFI